MQEKRKVYNGYEEHMMTGVEIKTYFNDAYLCFGKHHQKVSSYRINFEKYYSKIKDDITYRVFINENFCKIMNSETDENIYFFGYTKNKPLWAKD